MSAARDDSDNVDVMDRFQVGAAVGGALLVSLLSACGGGESTDADDVMFAQMMIPHHEQALVMTELASAQSRDPDVLQIAGEIEGAQGPEIELMASWLDAWGAQRLTGAEAGESHGAHGMAGMLTDEQLAALEAAQGDEFDEMFARLMIEHHEGAVSMARDVLANGQDPAVAELAQGIIEVQEREIAQLQGMQGS